MAKQEKALSEPGSHTIAIGDENNKYTYDVDSEGNVSNFRGADEPEPALDESGSEA